MAAQKIGWQPKVFILIKKYIFENLLFLGKRIKFENFQISMRDGLMKTIDYFRDEIQKNQKRSIRDDEIWGLLA